MRKSKVVMTLAGCLVLAMVIGGLYARSVQQRLLAQPCDQSRALDALQPATRAKAQALIAAAAKEGIRLQVTSTWRSACVQERLYAQGRSRPGNVVTQLRGGESLHNWGLAFDVVPLRGGQPVWQLEGEDGTLWAQVGVLGKAQGLRWGGDFRSFVDLPHFELPGLTRERALSWLLFIYRPIL